VRNTRRREVSRRLREQGAMAEQQKQFRKKPVVITAVRWDGSEACLVNTLLPFLADGHPSFDHLPIAPNDPHKAQGIGYTPALGEAYIPTLEGLMTAKPGDWIIRGVKGEFYPCKPDIFEATYDEVGESERAK
jgi:hypothetical protein